jgi:hypothetical protein
MTWARVWILTLQQRFSEALQVLERFRGETMFTSTTAPSPKAYLKGMIYLLQGDKVRAQPELEQARLVSEKLLREVPDDSTRHAQHGLILAALGQKQEAITEGNGPSNCYRNPRTLLMDREQLSAGPDLCLDW